MVAVTSGCENRGRPKEETDVPTAATRLMLVVSSFAPLWLALGLLEYPGAGWAAVPMYALAASGPLALWYYLRSVRRIAPTSETVVSASRREQDLIAYVATYLVPFAFVTADGWRPAVVLGLFLVVVVGLAAHSSLYYVNPLLAAAGFHLHEIETMSGSAATLITKRRFVPSGTILRVRTIDRNIYVDAAEAERARS